MEECASPRHFLKQNIRFNRTGRKIFIAFLLCIGLGVYTCTRVSQISYNLQRQRFEVDFGEVTGYGFYIDNVTNSIHGEMITMVHKYDKDYKNNGQRSSVSLTVF
jgi:hypothetical protein